ncbi:basic salivary proline-rich protein 3-like [Pteronotus mesoamericanus]|uniref:basic salivary proline-rich protein 3-like n=1 Tax=Pteronotus mesoamericanus TaxID=1884717 RepID=UPI0023ED7DCF|nr:basic salivary proline-rich protein 3-like [Pteronotus parnellii mesoamericanus]
MTLRSKEIKYQGTLQDSVWGTEKPRLFADKRPLHPSGMNVQGRGKRLRSARGQSEGRQWPRQPPAPHPGRRRNRGRGKGFSAARGLVAPHEPPSLPLRQRLDSPSARLKSCRQGPPLRPKASEHGTAPRHTHLERQPPLPQHGPWGSSLNCQPPPEGTDEAPGAAAKPPTPEGAVVIAAAEAQHPPSRIELLGRRSQADPEGAPPSRAGRARLRRDDRGAAGGDPQRSLQRRLGRSGRRRRWATAPPRPHARLRREDCGGRPGTSRRERQGARCGEGGGGALPALPSAYRPP